MISAAMCNYEIQLNVSDQVINNSVSRWADLENEDVKNLKQKKMICMKQYDLSN